MDKDGRYSLNACNIRLEMSKAQGIVEYYTNKKLLSEQLASDKINEIDSNTKFTKYKKKVKKLEINNKLELAIKGYEEFIVTNQTKYLALHKMVTAPPPSKETSVESLEGQLSTLEI